MRGARVHQAIRLRAASLGSLGEDLDTYKKVPIELVRYRISVLRDLSSSLGVPDTKSL
jgi:hypothetical protein